MCIRDSDEIGANLVLICVYGGRQQDYAISFTLKSLTKFFLSGVMSGLKVNLGRRFESGPLLNKISLFVYVYE